MTKKLWLIFGLLLLGCGDKTPAPTKVDTSPLKHSFNYKNQILEIKVPRSWKVLSAEKQVLFMARNGDENLAILERDLTSKDPSKQIIDSARSQFFDFKLDSQKANSWSFSGQIGPTNPPRTFWQQVIIFFESQTFLLASCSQHKNSPSPSSCGAILKSWKTLNAE